MNVFVVGALAAAGGFLLGAIPFGVILGRVFYRRDIRTEGSGNIGAANALRTLGRKGAAGVLVLDALKGALPVLVVNAAHGSTTLAAMGGFAAVVGHCYSPFLGWRGGKGVATSYGVVWALAWPAALAFTIVWIAAIIAAGFSSLASMLASLAMPFSLWFMIGRAGLWYGIVSALLIVAKHRGNIARLRAGTEHPLTLGTPRRGPKRPTQPQGALGFPPRGDL